MAFDDTLVSLLKEKGLGNLWELSNRKGGLERILLFLRSVIDGVPAYDPKKVLQLTKLSDLLDKARASLDNPFVRPFFETDLDTLAQFYNLLNGDNPVLQYMYLNSMSGFNPQGPTPTPIIGHASTALNLARFGITDEFVSKENYEGLRALKQFSDEVDLLERESLPSLEKIGLRDRPFVIIVYGTSYQAKKLKIFLNKILDGNVIPQRLLVHEINPYSSEQSRKHVTNRLSERGLEDSVKYVEIPGNYYERRADLVQAAGHNGKELNIGIMTGNTLTNDELTLPFKAFNRHLHYLIVIVYHSEKNGHTQRWEIDYGVHYDILARAGIAGYQPSEIDLMRVGLEEASLEGHKERIIPKGVGEEELFVDMPRYLRGLRTKGPTKLFDGLITVPEGYLLPGINFGRIMGNNLDTAAQALQWSQVHSAEGFNMSLRVYRNDRLFNQPS